LRSAPVLLALVGVVLTAALAARRTPGALLLGIASLTVAAWGLGLSPPPERLVRVPALPTQTLLSFELASLFSLKLLPVVFAFLFVDLFDTAGTLLGVGRAAGFLSTQGELPRANRAFAADAVATMAGAALGTSTVTTYVESASGVEEGGRTGLTAVVVAGLFLLALFFTPLFVAIPALATAPALVVVGAMMMGASGGLDWRRLEDGLPAFLTVALMPFTFSIANGIAAGLVTWSALRLLSGRAREGHPVLYLVSALLVLHYALG
jgi:AGZA family xanthine/uracil permease-like MFS transporter